MNRFYVEKANADLENNRVRISDPSEIQHMTKSLRIIEGDLIEISVEFEQNYLAVVDTISKLEIGLTLIEVLEDRELPVVVDLFQGVPKSQKWEYLIQKSVECGVHSIIPVQMKRSVAIVKEKSEAKKLARWQKIADEAAKQSKRSYRPIVDNAHSFKEALALQDEYDLVIIAYENEQQNSLKQIAHLVENAKKIAIWIGPEGGLDLTEVEQLSEIGQIITLGGRILRTESAALVLLSQIGYIIE